MIKLTRRGLSLFFLALAIASSKMHAAIYEILELAERINLGQWKRGLLILRLYDKFRNHKNGGGNDTDTD